MVQSETLEFASEVEYDAWYQVNKDRVVIQKVENPVDTFAFKPPYTLPWGKYLTIPPIVVTFLRFPQDP